MTNSTVAPSRFFSYRTLLGCLAGTAIWLIFAQFFNRPDQFTPYISLILAALLSGLSSPKHLAGLGAIIGIPVGTVMGIQLILPSLGQMDLVAWLTAYFSVSFIMIYMAAYCALLSFWFAQLARLYRRGAIF